MTRLTLDELNALPVGAFEAAVGPLFEHGGWITAGLAGARPFASLTALHRAAMARLRAADAATVRAFLCGHPALSPATLRRGVTAESMAEQRSAGIDTMDEAGAARLDAANAAHLARFGVPFILAIRGATLPTILAAMARRAEAGPEAEIAEAVREVEAISWMRLLDRVRPATTGGISTHVLDTVRSRPGAGLSGGLWRMGDGEACVARFTTDAEGRSGTMLSGGALEAGGYQLRLDTAAYLAGCGVATLDRSFLPSVVVGFSVGNPEEHFHVPVLLSHGSYTTYRGS